MDVAEVVKRHGFANLHRFLAEFWNEYGEMPQLPRTNR
jgi:hypothetical protein